MTTSPETEHTVVDVVPSVTLRPDAFVDGLRVTGVSPYVADDG